MYEQNSIQAVLAARAAEDSAPVRVAFFLGAGASVEAGIPDTSGLIRNFMESCEPDDVPRVKALLEILGGWAQNQSPKRIVDIELLLEALERLSGWEEDVLAGLTNAPHSIPPKTANVLLRKLRDFIKNQLIVRRGSIGYLGPLRGFVDQFRALDIYSANYDTAVELFRAEHKLRYRDGFDEEWNPEVFDDDGLDIRLFKVHGSVTWYVTDRGRFVKVPILVENSGVELITTERATALMLYPAQKFDYIEPLFELLTQMKRRLSECDVLFAVGYSFRDEHIRRMLWDIARANPSFVIALIDPRAPTIYEARLCTYEDGETPAPLRDRVVCLPFKFGSVFPMLQNDILLDVVRSRKWADEESRNGYRGQRTQWGRCALPAAKSGDYRLARKALERELENASGRRIGVEVSIWGLYYAILNGDGEHAHYYWRQIMDALGACFDALSISLGINQNCHDIMASLHDPSLNSLSVSLIRIRDSLRVMTNWSDSETAKPVRGVVNMLTALVDYVALFERTGRVTFDEYLRVRSDACLDTLRVSLGRLGQHNSSVLDGQDLSETVRGGVKDTEKRGFLSLLEDHRSEVLSTPSTAV